MAALAAALLSSCGGGYHTPPLQPVVSSASAGIVKYSQTLVTTVLGNYLDQGLAVSSPNCKNMTLGSAAPYVSNSTTAYYLCTASAIGPALVTVARSSDGATLATAPFNVVAPQVTLTVTNGLAVNGSLVVTLTPEKTPITVDNFLAYVNSGFYNGTVFHRVVAGFVIQGGGYGPVTPPVVPTEKPTNAPIKLEVGKGLSNLQWTIAMARTDVLDSATSQFFINVVDNLSLDSTGGGYAVFGNVSSNTALAGAIAAAPCAEFVGFSECVPNPNVVITSAVQTR